MVDTIMQILTWAIPSGGIGAAIAWVANRKVKQAEGAKQIHDTYKTMYQDISREWVETQEKLEKSAKENAKAIEDLNRENAKTRYALNRLSRAIEAIQLCPHRATCPVSGELQNGEEGADGADGADGGKRKARQQRKREPPKRDASGADAGRGMDASVDDTPGNGQPGDDRAHVAAGPGREGGVHLSQEDGYQPGRDPQGLHGGHQTGEPNG